MGIRNAVLAAMGGMLLLIGASAHAAYIGTDIGYSGRQVAADFRTVSGTASAFAGDDDWTSFVLPFAFNFYGRDYAAGSAAWISVNGLMGFEPDNAGDYCCNATMSFGAPTRTIQAGWFDLFGTVYTQTNGSAGNRELVVTWDGNEYDDSDANGVGAANLFQAILHEGSNDIEFQYATLNNLRHYASVGGIRGDDESMGLNFIDFSQNVSLNDVGLMLHFDPLAVDVPEPGSALLLALGMAGLAAARRTKRRAG
ncbi:PEP-CTERM sorting domain-containing protein [Massilia sp. R2A-15]|uniref:PEP-CTERM sorting domain-containing protein n=1 Tax=Massilia sp. R2A-15 TaxID=3064278 RepID=UPI002733EE0C|nr:PEP-CTERM sorting domain-containing protein [Massilia sp. R2A-15]WLI88717.1 PEP-CTERM sorting domain-containing protein [Massilia sp. R2A-15]